MPDEQANIERAVRKRRVMIAGVLLVGASVIGLGLLAAAPAAARSLGITEMKVASREWAKRSSARQAGEEAVREAERNIERFGDEDEGLFRRRDDDRPGRKDKDPTLGTVTGKAELRSGPGEDAEVLGLLGPGDRVVVLEERLASVRVLVTTDDGALVGWLPRRRLELR